MHMDMRIRPLQLEDKAEWLPLWHQYLVFYQHELSDEQTLLTFERLASGEGPVFGLAAFDSDRMLGFAHYSFTFSTWEKNAAVYLEDLFVEPDARSRGVARALIDAVGAEAQRLGAERLHWITQASNERARRLYDQIATLSEFVIYEQQLGK